MTQTQEVLDFWFAGHGMEDWFQQADAFDAKVQEQFNSTLNDARAGALDQWFDEGPEGALALILVLDQFPRNIYRQSAEAFASDGLALAWVKKGLHCGDDLWLKNDKPGPYRAFYYMPLMHSEQMADQLDCIRLFEAHGPEENVAFARQHADIIHRFGRFPHRNALLGRLSTPEEEVFLNQPNSSF